MILMLLLFVGEEKRWIKGGKMIRKLNKLSFMGFWEVFKNLFTVFFIIFN